MWKKNRFWWKFFSEKIFFGSFYSKKRQLLQLCVFSKTNNSFEKRKKNSFPIKVFEKNQILKPVFNNESDSNQVFQNGTIFCWTLHNSSFFVSEILQRVRFWNILFTTHQVLNGNFNSVTDFHVKLVPRHQAFLDSLLSKIFFSIYIVKMSNLRFPSFLERLILRAIFLKENILWIGNFEKNQILNQFFHNAPDFLTKQNFSCQSLNWVPHSVRTWVKVFTTPQFLMKKVLLENQDFLENWLSRNHLSGQFTP